MTGPLSTVILAAGEGTRMRSKLPKVLHPIAGRPLVEHAVRAAAGLDPDRLVVVVGHGREAVTDHLARLETVLGRPVTSVVQESRKGTGHAVSCAFDALPSTTSGTVLVTYGDVPLLDTDTLAALLAEHRKQGNAVTVLTAVVDDPTGYGRIVRDDSGKVVGIVEHKDAAPEQLAITEINSGVYAFDTAVLVDALSRISADNAQGELYLTDVIGVLSGMGHRVGRVSAPGDETQGVNDRWQLALAERELRSRTNRHWLLNGVTMHDPRQVFIDVTVDIGRDVTLLPGTMLHGNTTVHDGCEIGPGTRLTDTVVESGATIEYTVAVGAKIGAGATVGPYAHLRGGAVVVAGERTGAFYTAGGDDQ